MSRLIVTVSGVRGEIGKTLTPDVAAKFGAAFGTMLGKGKRVVIGRDSRPSGPAIRNGVAAGLMACGVDVTDLGIVSTPGVSLMTRQLKADGGVMITASHNPIPWNGIKFFRADGIGLFIDQAAALKTIWESGNFAYADPTICGKESKNPYTHSRHVDAVLAIVDRTAIAAKRIKVVLDSVNGAGGEATAQLLSKLGAELVHLNARPTGIFPHMPEPTEENLQDLCQEVRRHKAQIGLAQDPDADRLALVDENGSYIGEEYTLAICAAATLSRRKGDLAANLSTSRMIDDIAAAAGVKVFRTPVGEANVASRMAAEGCIFGGEGNGGVIDPRVVPIRDSLVGIGIVLGYLAHTGKTLSQIVAEIPRYEMVKTKMECAPDAAAKLAAAAKKHFSGRAGASFNDSDGLRIDLAEGWVHVRGSNTEPILRIIAEASTRPAAEALIAEVKRLPI